MALPRFEKLDADRRNRVMAAAVFAAKGYEGTTLEAIAENLGIG